MNDTLQTLIRSVLKVGGGFLLAKGVSEATPANMETVAGGLIAIVGIVLGFFKAKKTEAAKPPGQ